MSKAKQTKPAVAVPVDEKALARVAPDVATISEAAAAIVIVDAESQKAAAELRRQCKARAKEVADFFKPIKDALNKAKSALLEREHQVADPYLAAAEVLATKDLAYTRVVETRRREAELEAARKAQAEAQERQAHEAELARAYGLEDLAVELEEAPVAPAMVMELPAPPAPEPVPSGQHYRTNYSVELLDVLAVAKWVLENPAHKNLLAVNFPTANGLARTLRDGFNVPGLRLHVTKTLVDKL